MVKLGLETQQRSLKMKTAFCSVVFPNNEKYFSDFLDSLELQTDKDFTLLLFNDGVQNINNYFKERSLKKEVINVSGSIAGIRTFMLDYIKQSDFQMIVFGDTDDFFSHTRVAVSKKLLKDYDVVGTDLNIVSSDGKIIQHNYWGNREEVKREISLLSILEYNFLGLGNTAIRREILPENCVFPEGLKVIDWYLFSIILFNKASVFFTSEATVSYRQHNQNIVGRKQITLDKFKQGFEVKLNHYCLLANVNDVLKNKYKYYNSKKELVKQLALFTFELKINNPFWWEEINIDKL